MTVQVLLKIIQKFEKKVSFNVQSGRGRKRFDLVEVFDSTADEMKAVKWPQKCRWNRVLM